MTTRPYTKTARAEREQQTRNAILDATDRAFFAEGVTSLEAIAREAGTTKQTLLRHFGSREGLLRAAYERDFARVRDQRLEAPAGDIEAAVDNLLDHYAADGLKGLKIATMAGGLFDEIVANAKRMHYEWVEHAFSRWLDAAAPREREHLRGLLIVLCDVQSWNILANDLTFDRRATRASLILAIRRILREDA